MYLPDILKWMHGPQHLKFTQQTHILYGNARSAFLSPFSLSHSSPLGSSSLSTLSIFCHSLRQFLSSSQDSLSQSRGSPHSCAPRCPGIYDP